MTTALDIEQQEPCMQGSAEDYADRLIVTDWTSMTDGELVTIAYNSSRKARAILRERLLPAIREVRRRFAAGQQVGEFQGIEDFYRHIGVNPNTVYSWERRARLLTEGTVPAKSERAERTDTIRIAPGFAVAKLVAGAPLPHGAYTVDALAKFLGCVGSDGKPTEFFKAAFDALGREEHVASLAVTQ